MKPRPRKEKGCKSAINIGTRFVRDAITIITISPSLLTKLAWGWPMIIRVGGLLKSSGGNVKFTTYKSVQTERNEGVHLTTHTGCDIMKQKGEGK